jgi:hypothetical protein
MLPDYGNDKGMNTPDTRWKGTLANSLHVLKGQRGIA